MDELAIKIFLFLRKRLPLQIRIVTTNLTQAQIMQPKRILVDQLMRPIVIFCIPKYLL